MWIKVKSTEDLPLGMWLVYMEDGEYGYCEVAQGGSGKFAVINGHFYFDLEPVVAYMPMPQYIPKGGA